MKSLTKAVMLVVMAALLLAGCGSSEKASVDKNKEVVIGIPSITESFNFYHTTNGYESYSMAQVYDSLVAKGADGKIVPSLAEAFEVSPDGLQYTFHLRKGVKFSNGAELKAADIVFSMNEALKSSYTSFAYKPLIAACEIKDDYTVVMKLKKGNMGFLDYLSNINYFAVLNEKAVTEAGDAYGTSPDKIVGTGAYKVKDWKPGSYVVYEANNDYFLGKPSIQKVRLKAIADSNTAVIALQTGEIMAYFDNVPGVSYNTVKNAGTLNLIDYPTTTYFEVIMNCKNGIFADPALRKAVALAVDRQNMLSVGVEGQGKLADYPGNRSGYTAGDPELKEVWYKTDIEAAKKIVEKAGLTGKAVTIKTYSSAPYPQLATVLQSALRSIGLQADVLQMDRSAFIDEALTKGDFEIGICRWAAGTKDMDEIWTGSLATSSIGITGNWSWYSNPKLDDLLAKAAGETNADTRKGLYKQVVDIFLADIPQIPLYYPSGSRAYSKQLTIDNGLVEYDKIFNYSWAK